MVVGKGRGRKGRQAGEGENVEEKGQEREGRQAQSLSERAWQAGVVAGLPACLPACPLSLSSSSPVPACQKSRILSHPCLSY